jgi:serine/threonine protein kinase
MMAAELATALGDRYALERELGRGGMATVYLARDLKHARLVAIKVLRAELWASAGPESGSCRRSASPPVCSIPTSSRCSTPARWRVCRQPARPIRGSSTT